MASKMIYTSRISVPVYVSWRCQKCNNINISGGVIVTTGSETSYSFNKDRLAEAKEAAKNKAWKVWVDNTLRYMRDPCGSFEKRDVFLSLQSNKCSKCKKSPIWIKRIDNFELWGIPGILITLIGLSILLIDGFSSGLGWGITAFGIAEVLASKIVISIHKSKLYSLPKRYKPVMGSQNEDLVLRTEMNGQHLLTPEETVERVMLENDSN